MLAHWTRVDVVQVQALTRVIEHNHSVILNLTFVVQKLITTSPGPYM